LLIHSKQSNRPVYSYNVAKTDMNQFSAHITLPKI